MPLYRSLYLFLILASTVGAEELRTLGGKTVSGSLQAISDTEITLRTEAGSVATPLAQVLALDLRPVKGVGPGRYSDVRLLDDTVLHCLQVGFKGNQVHLTLLSELTVTLPMSHVVSIVHEAQNETLMKKWLEVTAPKIRRDRLVILREGELNALEGTLGDIDAEGQTIQFKREGASALPVRFDRLHGLTLFRLEAPADNPLCRVFDVQGNTFTAVKLALEGPNCLVTTSFGAKIPMPLASVARFDFNMGKLTYLSDLEPKMVRKPPIEWDTQFFFRDANVEGKPIFFDKAHAKGVSLRGPVEIEYNLGGKYKEFKAILGADMQDQFTELSAKPVNNAVVSIYCDGEKRFVEGVQTKVFRPVAINVKDVQVLRIQVSFRNSPGSFLPGIHCHATLAEARVSQ